MDTKEFWAIIEPGKNTENPEVSLKTELQNLSATKIVEFQRQFDNRVDESYRWDLWGAAYLIHGGCSDDGFIDFRYSLISKGQDVFEKALVDPDSLAQLGADVDLDNELFGYVAGDVHEQVAKSAIPMIPSTAADDPAGEEWDFDDDSENQKRLPKLFALFDESQ